MKDFMVACSTGLVNYEVLVGINPEKCHEHFRSEPFGRKPSKW
jgi:hypothetical protein